MLNFTDSTRLAGTGNYTWLVLGDWRESDVNNKEGKVLQN